MLLLEEEETEVRFDPSLRSSSSSSSKLTFLSLNRRFRSRSQRSSSTRCLIEDLSFEFLTLIVVRLTVFVSLREFGVSFSVA